MMPINHQDHLPSCLPISHHSYQSIFPVQSSILQIPSLYVVGFFGLSISDVVVKLLALALTNLVLDLSNLVTNLAKLSLG